MGVGILRVQFERLLQLRDRFVEHHLAVVKVGQALVRDRIVRVGVDRRLVSFIAWFSLPIPRQAQALSICSSAFTMFNAS